MVHAANFAAVICEHTAGISADARIAQACNVAAASCEEFAGRVIGTRSTVNNWLAVGILANILASLLTSAVGSTGVLLDARRRSCAGISVGAAIRTIVAGGEARDGARASGIIAIPAVDEGVAGWGHRRACAGFRQEVCAQTARRAGVGQHTNVDGGLFGVLEGGIVLGVVLGGDGGRRTRTGRVGRDRPLDGGAGGAGGAGRKVGAAIGAGTACVRACVNIPSDRIGWDRTRNEGRTERRS